MTPLTRIKLLVAVAGVCVWAVGVQMGEERLKWAGIALLAVAFLLRLFKEDPSARSDGDSKTDDPRS